MKSQKVHSIAGVHHIETDLRDDKRLLFNEGERLVSYDMEQWKRINEYSFTDNLITGFVQLNEDLILAIEYSCILKLNRKPNPPAAAVLAGKFDQAGATKDGRASVARFYGLNSIIIDKRDQSYVIVSDRNNQRLRSINVKHGEVTTLHQFTSSKPYALLWFNDKLLVSTNDSFHSLEWDGQHKKITQLNGASADRFGLAKWIVFNTMEILNKDLIIATADSDGSLKVINMKENTIVPVCIGTTTCESSFKLFDTTGAGYGIHSTLITNNGLYVGGKDQGQSLYRLTGKFEYCFVTI